MHSCLHTCVKYISGFRCPALLHPTFFFVHFSHSIPFSSCFFIYLSDCNQSLTLQLNGDGDTPLPLIGWNQARTSANHSHRSASLSLSLFIFLSFFASFKRSNSGQLAWTPNKQTKNDAPHSARAPFHWHFKLNVCRRAGEGICNMSGSVWERRHWLWVFAWDVCVSGAVSRAGGQKEEPGWANLWEDHPFLFFHSHLWMFFFFLCFSHSLISYLWNGVSVSTCCIPPFFYLPSFGAFTHSSSLFQSS